MRQLTTVLVACHAGDCPRSLRSLQQLDEIYEGHAGNASWMSAMDGALASPSDLTYGDALLANPS